MSRAVKIITENIFPQKIFLFGSRAANTTNEKSDYDLFVIVKNGKKTREQVEKYGKTIYDRKTTTSTMVKNNFQISLKLCYSKGEKAKWLCQCKILKNLYQFLMLVQ